MVSQAQGRLDGVGPTDTEGVVGRGQSGERAARHLLAERQGRLWLVPGERHDDRDGPVHRLQLLVVPLGPAVEVREGRTRGVAATTQRMHDRQRCVDELAPRTLLEIPEGALGELLDLVPTAGEDMGDTQVRDGDALAQAVAAAPGEHQHLGVLVGGLGQVPP